MSVKKKKELMYPLAVRDQEVRFIVNERSQLTNSSITYPKGLSSNLLEIIAEISTNFMNVPLKKLSPELDEEEEKIDFASFYQIYKEMFFISEMHRVLFKNQQFEGTFNNLVRNLYLSQQDLLHLSFSF